MESIAKFFNHDFENGRFTLYDSNNNCVYHEYPWGYWNKSKYDFNNNETYYENSYESWEIKEFDKNNNRIYYENSNKLRIKKEFDKNNNCIYYENSDGYIEDNRPKSRCHNKIVEIEGKQYQLKEIK